jgi:hypothetical protein
VARASARRGLSVERRDAERLVRARPADIDAYAIALGKSDIAVRGLELRHTSLEALFFRLTEDEDEAPEAREGAVRREVAA